MHCCHEHMLELHYAAAAADPTQLQQLTQPHLQGTESLRHKFLRHLRMCTWIPVPSDCLPHGLRIETRAICVLAHDDSVVMSAALAATSTCRPKGRISGPDCPSLLQIGAWPILGHQPVHTPIDSNPVHRPALGNAMAPERRQLWQLPTLTSGWPLEVPIPPKPRQVF